jgi:hypothetical protein
VVLKSVKLIFSHVPDTIFPPRSIGQADIESHGSAGGRSIVISRPKLDLLGRRCNHLWHASTFLNGSGDADRLAPVSLFGGNGVREMVSGEMVSGDGPIDPTDQAALQQPNDMR